MELFSIFAKTKRNMKKSILFALVLCASAAVAQPPKAKCMSAKLVPGIKDTLYLTYFQDSTETVHQFVLTTGIKAGETVEITPDGVRYAGQTYANHFQALKTSKQ